MIELQRNKSFLILAIEEYVVAEIIHRTTPDDEDGTYAMTAWEKRSQLSDAIDLLFPDISEPLSKPE